MLVRYLAYERVAPIAINTVAESLGYINQLVRLFCHAPVCFVYHAATSAGGKLPPISSPVCSSLYLPSHSYPPPAPNWFFFQRFDPCYLQERLCLSSTP